MENIVQRIYGKKSQVGKKETIKCVKENGWECYDIESEEDWEEIKQNILDIDVHTEKSFYCEIDDIFPYI